MNKTAWNDINGKIIKMDESQKTLETIWRVPDELWNKLKLILNEVRIQVEDLTESHSLVV